ncbi:MAG: hypothetical protein IJP01_04130 [Oscillospiraceae bacterium]|nr:hypothetical protein [Oscillospiraceae bacterium]
MKQHFARQCGLMLPNDTQMTEAQLTALLPALRESGISVLLLPQLEADYTAQLYAMRRRGFLQEHELPRLRQIPQHQQTQLLRKGFSRCSTRQAKKLARFAAGNPWHMARAETEAAWQLQQTQSTRQSAVYDEAAAGRETQFQLYLKYLQHKQHTRLLRQARRHGITLAQHSSLPMRLQHEQLQKKAGRLPVLQYLFCEAAQRCSLLLVSFADAVYTSALPRSFEAACARLQRRKPRGAPKRLQLAVPLPNAAPQLIQYEVKRLANVLQNSGENAVLAAAQRQSAEEALRALTPQQLKILQLQLDVGAGEPLAPCVLDRLLRSDARLVMLTQEDFCQLLGFHKGAPFADAWCRERIYKKLQYYARAL